MKNEHIEEQAEMVELDEESLDLVSGGATVGGGESIICHDDGACGLN